jgi:hypothetical protein
MIFRMFVSMGLLALGYYVGREIGRGEPIRKDLKDWRDDATRKQVHSRPQTPSSPADDSKR